MVGTGRELCERAFTQNDFSVHSYKYFFPSSFKAEIFEFDVRCKRVIIGDGITNEVVREITPEEFINEYGDTKLYDCASYEVYWPILGYSWDN